MNATTQLTTAPAEAAPSVPTTGNLSTALDAARAVYNDLDSQFFERAAEIRCLVVGLIAREHVVFIGEPGTGKSALTNEFCRAISGAMFQRLLTKFTTDSEIFGPVSVKGLKDDKFERNVAGFLPTADVAFLDEIFKANSAILNAMLTALNERAFDNGPTRMPIPLQMCIGASNELPQDASLAALYDRFTLRRWVEGVKSETNLIAMMTMNTEPTATARLSAEEIETLREARKKVNVAAMVPVLLELFKELEKQHGIKVSDRTKRKCRKLVQANALFNGHTTAVKGDLRVLVDVLWNEPSERLLVEQTYTDTVGPDDAALAAQLIAAAVEAAGRVNLQERGRAFTIAASDANEKMNQILAELDKLQGAEADLARTRVIDLLSPIREELMRRIGHA